MRAEALRLQYVARRRRKSARLAQCRGAEIPVLSA